MSKKKKLRRMVGYLQGQIDELNVFKSRADDLEKDQVRLQKRTTELTARHDGLSIRLASVEVAQKNFHKGVIGVRNVVYALTNDLTKRLDRIQSEKGKKKEARQETEVQDRFDERGADESVK